MISVAKVQYQIQFGALALLAAAGSAGAMELRLDSGGMRGAFSNPFNHARFYHLETYLNWDTPWHWAMGREWELRTRLELTGGWMSGRGDNSIFGSIGPGFVVSWKDFPVMLEAGVSPTLLGREQFGNTDFGTVFQFTTHGGLTWRMTSRLDLGVRFEHLSNANIGPSNPGVNLYSVGVGWRF